MSAFLTRKVCLWWLLSIESIRLSSFKIILLILILLPTKHAEDTFLLWCSVYIFVLRLALAADETAGEVVSLSPRGERREAGEEGVGV
jgi:hypothetical protein